MCQAINGRFVEKEFKSTRERFAVILFYNSLGKPFLQSQLGTAPRATLHVVFDSVVRAEANPVRQRTILSLLLGQSALCAESLLGRLGGKGWGG